MDLDTCIVGCCKSFSGVVVSLFLFCSVQPGASLEQTHIFVLAHILRRPIIVYGVKYYKSFRGETLGYTRFQGKHRGRTSCLAGIRRVALNGQELGALEPCACLPFLQGCTCLCCGNRVFVGRVRLLWAIRGATSLLWSPWRMMAMAAEVLVLT